jgi:RimJ/RimL family protein N-acetyltransferase
MNENSYTANELGDKPKELTMKEINERYVNRIIESLENDKELWEREVMCGMDGCFTEYYSPKYPTKDGGTLSFSDRNYVSAYIDGKFVWEIGFWDYNNPFSKRASKLRKAIQEMVEYHIEKSNKEYKEKLTKSIK